jgi:hypothetical protein
MEKIFICIKCEQVIKPEDKYPRRRMCRPCHLQMERDTYNKNKEKYKQQYKEKRAAKKKEPKIKTPKELKENEILKAEIVRLQNIINQMTSNI